MAAISVFRFPTIFAHPAELRSSRKQLERQYEASLASLGQERIGEADNPAFFLVRPTGCRTPSITHGFLLFFVLFGVESDGELQQILDNFDEEIRKRQTQKQAVCGPPTRIFAPSFFPSPLFRAEYSALLSWWHDDKNWKTSSIN